MTIEMKDTDFCVIKEDFSRFILEDETVIKAKIVLKKIFMSPVSTPEGYPTETAFDAENIVVAVVPQHAKRPPSAEPINPSVDRGEEIPFVSKKQQIQEYLTDNGFRVSIQPVLSKVFRYPKFNAYGEPVYNVILQQITSLDKTQSTAT